MARLFVAFLGASAVAGLRMDKAEESGLLSLAQVLARGLPKEFNTTRLRILADIQQGRPGSEEEDGYDCENLPHMCKSPFHCDQWTHQDTLDIRMHGLATSDGHYNLRSWCMPGLERWASTVVRECIVRSDLRESAKVSMHRNFNDYADELEASYCFAEGHCTNNVASDKTTMADMELMCDYRFGGRKGWTRNFVKSLKRIMDMPKNFANLASMKNGISTQRITRILAKMACAQGTFHCDIQHCKHTYCRDEYYVQKYSHLLPPFPGNMMQDPDMTKELLFREGEDI